ncbi:hypothetical protein J5U18_08760 [Sphingobacteriaceae bacterium WQ 2009]|uniref:Uncharacterized protein n=1 Tax=Rhinopithecimicrobium faecis TaxID=2820698 RepID=A0A8T4H956_9SPHI|nr:hypothetical protein [Sphingobacteriaceae bacterium WQ 2009]
MKKHLLYIFLATTTLTPIMAKNANQLTQVSQNSTVLGKFIVVKEYREILRDGKKTESSTEIVEDGLIYHFKSEKLVTVFWPDNNQGINFSIERKGNSYALINKHGEAEDDELLLKKNSPLEVIFVRETADGDEDGEILVRSTFYLKPIK